MALEALELRTLFSAAFDVTQLTQLRADPAFAGVDGSDLSVAVLDTGLFGSHPDISGNFVRFFDAVGNGTSAQTNPGTGNAAESFDPPGEGHGTHVSGTVGSTNPEIGVATGTNLIGVRVLLSEGDASPQVNPLVAGLQWVLTNQTTYNIRVVNMSLGNNTNFNSIPNKDDVGRLIDQLEARGVTVVSAAGNSYGGFASPGVAYPSIFSTITVANTWEDSGTPDEREQVTLGQGNGGLFGVLDEDPNADQLSASSQRSGTLPNQLAAPGTTIFSTWNGDDGLLYNTIAGTSMASPFVAGTVALMQDAALTFGGRYLSPDEVLNILRSTADDVVDTQDPGTARFPVGRNAFGQLVQTGPVQDLPETGATFKRVNVYRAVQEVRNVVTGGTQNPTPPPDPGQRTDDTNNITTAAVPVPSLNGLNSFQVTGNIGADGNVAVGSADVDLFRIQLDSPGFPVFDLDPAPGGALFDPVVRLFNASGGQLATADDSGGDLYPVLNTESLGTPLDAGTYYVGVSSAPNTNYTVTTGAGAVGGSTAGDYLINIALTNPDPDGVVQGARTIDLINPDGVLDGDTPANVATGRIGSDPNPTTPSGLPLVEVGAKDVDFFEILAPDTGRLTIDIDAIDVVGISDPLPDSYVAVYDEALNTVAFNDDEIFTQLLDSLLVMDVVQGQRYFVAVTTFQNKDFSVTNPFDRMSDDISAVGNYEVYFSFDNGDINGTVLSALNFDGLDNDDNGVIDGEIGADNAVPLLSTATNGGAKDVDYFTVTPTVPGLLQIDVDGAEDFDAVIGTWIFNDDGDLVPLADTIDGPSSIGIEIGDALLSETFFISVTGVGNQGFSPFAVGSGTGGETGSYTLTITQRSQQEFLSLTNGSIQSHTPETVSVGEPLRRDIGRDGTIDVGDDDVDIYRFDSPFTGALTIRTDTSDEDSADTFLRVFDASGAEIAFNNNAGTATTASLVTIDVVAGTTYFIGVNGSSGNARAYDPLTGAGAVAGSQGHYALVLEASNTDQPFLSVADAAAVTEVLAAEAPATFTVTLGAPSANPVTVNFATADSTAVAGADYVATSGTLTFAPGETSKTVTVQVIGDFDEEAGEAFNLALSAATGALIGDGTGFANIVNTTPTVAPVAFNSAQPATFTDADGGTITVSIRGPGTGTILFASENSDPGRIVLTGTTAASTLNIRGDTSVADLIVNGSLKSLGSRTMDLTGNVSVTGAVAKVTFDDITGAILTLGSGTVTIAADQVSDLTVNSQAAIRSMKVGAWTDTDATPDVITAPSLGTLSVRGAFQAGIAAGVIGRVTVSGAVSGAAIRSDSSIAGLTVGSITDSLVFAGVAGSVLPDSSDDFTSPGEIKTFTVRGRTAGSFSDTLIAAATLGKVGLGGPVATANGGQTFGVAGNTIKSVSGSTDAGDSLRRSNLDDPAGSFAAVDFVLRVL